uniref:DNA-binding protein HU-beta (NS1) (HU-1) n=1 Tax=mine drainage metagenome TaxID=410659 RepID=E6QNV0_9ZZZZ
MNKQELITQVAKTAEISHQQAAAVINAVVHAVTDTMSAGENVSLVGFGTFSVSERPARQGRNPATGATIDIPARKSPTFKAGKGLKDAVIDGAR